MSDLSTERSYQTTRETIVRWLLLLKRALRRRFVLALTVVAALTAAFYAPRLLKPLYSSYFVLMYRETVAPESFSTEQFLREGWRQKSARYIDLVLSRSNLERLIEDFDLYSDIRKRKGMVEAVQEFRRRLDVDATNASSLMVRYYSTERDKLLPVLERLEGALKRQPAADSASQAAATTEFLQEEYDGVSEQLREKESALAEFLARHPEFARDGPLTMGQVGVLARARDSTPQGSSASAGRASALARQAARLRHQIELHRTQGPEAAAAAAQAERKMLPEDKQRIEAAQSLAETTAEQLRQLQKQFTAAHPDVIAARNDLSRLRAEVSRLKAAARYVDEAAPATNASVSLESLEAQLARVQRALSNARGQSGARAASGDEKVDDIVALETQWATLNREVQSAKEHHESVGRRLFQAATIAKLASLGGDGQMVTVDPPFDPVRPVARGPRTIAAATFLAVMVLGFAVALLLTIADDRIYHEYDLLDAGAGAIAITIAPLKPAERKATT